jgi:hypothetical protein
VEEEIRAALVPCHDRRIRDVWPCPKRRDGEKRPPREFTARELELLDLIDGHIARIQMERELKETL